MHTVYLKDGLKVGDIIHYEVTLKAPLAGDLLAATEDAEKLVITPDGYQMMASDTRLSAEILRRQIVSIGTVEGPLELAILNKLTAHDFELLNNEAMAMDAAYSKEIATRGKLSKDVQTPSK